ncbi:hypothetical protein QR680_009945 [Steinernema hermaphroditum]|uniref:FAS1 domain-containing protein n=1 Tax=Steinernema hermaphroditum TaxID=289476 RepID=A0AA39IM71_9BILA|nr:hypothetical protein QR680_009945 [Steinernema hermaphroditum]
MRTVAALFLTLISVVYGDLWSLTATIYDLKQFRSACDYFQTCVSYMRDGNAPVTVFAPVNDVFLYQPNLMYMTQVEILNHFVNSQVPDIALGKRWPNQTLVRTSVQNGYVFITQFENNPGNYSYFANAGRICNHESGYSGMTSGQQYLYKICSPMGNQPYLGTALSLVNDAKGEAFPTTIVRFEDLSDMSWILNREPDIALVIFGSSSYNAFHTFFIPTNKAFSKVIDRNRIDREVILAHVTGKDRVLFSYPWLYDGGLHYYPTVRFSANLIEDNFKLKLSMRNITDHRTGRWDLYAVSEVYERYGQFRRGAVWAKILVPNIPVQNGVVHIIDNVLGVVTNTIDQLVMDNYRCTRLMRYINSIGGILRSYLQPMGGTNTFFAPLNEAFERIPEHIERRLLQDKTFLEEVLRLHIVPNKELVTDEITNETAVVTAVQNRLLYFIRGEWPTNNITYYVIGAGTQATIYQDDVAATNGIVHYIDRVLGVPYNSLWMEIVNNSQTRMSAQMISNLQLQYTLDTNKIFTPMQQMTFFVPTDRAWQNVPYNLMKMMTDGEHWLALQFVFKRHVIQGQALAWTDFREMTFTMMNDEKVVMRRRGRYFELYWPRGDRVARIIEGGEIAGLNGYIHLIDNVLMYEPDLYATACRSVFSIDLMAVLVIIYLFLR